jgi:hypothetical protein
MRNLHRSRSRPARHRHPCAERLEDRTLFAVQAIPLPFTPFQNAHAAGRIAAADDFTLYAVSLGVGDVVSASIAAQASGSGLQSVLRVFDPTGHPIALDDQEGGDPRLTFQAPAAGNYLVGVSSAGDDAYDPTADSSGQGGTTTGLYALDLRRTAGAALTADLAGGSVRLTTTTAAYGDRISGTFTVDNRGGADAGAFDVQVVLSATNRFGPSSLVLATLPLPGLGAGQELSTGGSVTLPDLARAKVAGLPASGPVYVGLRIDPAGAVPELDSHDQSGVHRGEDWETLTVLAPVPAGVTNLSQADPSLDTRADGTLLTPGQADRYTFTVTGFQGSGRLMAAVAPTAGTLVPLLTLAGPDGEVLIQSGGQIVQHLQPGRYTLTVSARSGMGAYRLTSEFVQASPPFDPVGVGENPGAVAVADLNGDGIPDLVVANRGRFHFYGDTVSVLLGNGDGTFQPRQIYTGEYYPTSVAVADLNGDGVPDLVVANGHDNAVSVLLGNGDGTFQRPQTFRTGYYHTFSVAVADLNGDGKPDLVVGAGGTVSVLLGNGDGTFHLLPYFGVGAADAETRVAVADLNGDGIPDLVTATSGQHYPGDTVSVLLGNGDGTFQDQDGALLPHQRYAVGDYPTSVAVADVTGDGIPDIVTTGRGRAGSVGTVSVLPGNGDGTFRDQQTFPVGSAPSAVAVADMNGDGIPDIIAANGDSNTVSVLLGNGGGTFRPQQSFPVGAKPSAAAVADLDGDGKPDLVVANLYSNTVSVLPGNGDGSLRAEPAFSVGVSPSAVATADLNGDGNPDIITANGSNGTVSVLLGSGDGTLRPQQTFAAGYYPTALAVADLNGDGKPDIIIANLGNQTISVLLGNGDGTFQPPQTYPVGGGRDALAVADLNGDHIPDLIAAGGNGTVSVLLGKGDGTFQPAKKFTIGGDADAVAVADLNGDGIPDLVVIDKFGYGGDGKVFVLLGKGDGTFQPEKTSPAGPGADAVAVADLNGDGIPDIITANRGNYDKPGDTVSVLLGRGDGTFRRQKTFHVGADPNAVAVADLNGDGRPDIITANGGSGFYPGDTVSVLPGNGDGTFQPQQTFQVGDYPDAVTVADLAGDGRPDIITANAGSFSTVGGTVSVLLNNGHGSFPSPQTYPVGAYPYAVAVADLNGDGKPDLVTANGGDGTVSVLLGQGDGTFQPQQTFPVGGYPYAVAVADLNGDGIPDIITSDGSSRTVSVLLGNGDGSFQTPQTFRAGGYSDALAVADLNGDGIPDIITADRDHGTASVLLGNGDGTFQTPQKYDVGEGADALAVADLNGDGIPDLIAASYYGTVSVLLGNGDGTFQPQQSFNAGGEPTSVAVADLNGDGIPDIITANRGSYGRGVGTVSVLPGNGDGTFRDQQIIPVGLNPSAVAVADMNGDGIPDIVAAIGGSDTVTVLLGNGDGTFPTHQTFPVGSYPAALSVADLNGDGRPDIITANPSSDTVSVLLVNGGDGPFTTSSPIKGVPLRNTPILADLTGDGIPDSAVLDRSGNILFRKGLPGGGDQFAPPVILNPGRPARDLALVNTPAGPALASADVHSDPTLASPDTPFVYTVSLYTVAPDGTPRRTTAFSTPFVPSRIAVGDLTGDGWDDLVVADSFDDRVQVAFQRPDGSFSALLTRSTGEAPSDISLTDVNGDGLPDIVVSDQAGGLVTVYLNDPGHAFDTSYRLRAGLGPYGLDPTTATPAVSSLEQSVSLAAGDFTGDGRNDLVVLNRGSDSFTVLPNDGSGGFADPQAALTTSTSDGLAVNAQAGPLVAGHFHGPTEPLDLAVLMPDNDQVWVYTGDGHGHFTHTASVPAGNAPTGLSVVPGSGLGLLDLLVGDEFGDVLRLVGDGHGDFRPPPPATGDRVSLAVQELGNGRPTVLVANQQSDRVTVQAAQPGSPQFVPVVSLANGTKSTLAPGAVQWAKLDKGSPYYDAVVVASGANAILVYRGNGFDAAGNPTFAAPVSYSVGTDPVNVTIQDVNGDHIPDMLVVDQGSNDIAELFGSYDAAGDWVATPGPRLKSGGSGPVAVSVRDVAGDGVLDLVVTNGQSGTLTVLPGVGQGFFNDQNPQVLKVPGNPVLEAPSFFGTSNQGVVATADGRLIGFNLGEFALSVGPVFAPPAGDGVAAAEALADGHVVAALDGGEVVDLAPVGGGLVVDAALLSLTGIPSDPSALAVLQGESSLQVLVTSAGGDRVYVFGIPGLPESPPLPPAEAPPGPTVEVTPPAEGSLTLVVTLIAGPLPAGDAAAAEVPAAGAAAPAPPADPAGGGPGAGAEEMAAGAGDGGPRPGEGGIDVDGQLRGIDLYQPPPNPDRPGPSARRPDVPGRRDRHQTAPALAGNRPQIDHTAAARPPEPESAESRAAPAVAAEPAERAQGGAAEAADAVFALATAGCDMERARLLALVLAGCAWYAWPDSLCGPSRRRPNPAPRRKSSRSMP